VSGIVQRVGAEVSAFAPGYEVFSRPDIDRDGAYAEYLVMRASVAAKKPRVIDHIRAAGVPLAGLTAWHGLFDASTINLSKGQTVLIHGGAGGVGTLAVQLARWKGAKVIATASSENESYVRGLGADQVVDYRKVRFEDVVRDVDAVLDLIGGDTQKRSLGVLKPGGVLATTVGLPSPPSESAARRVRTTSYVIEPNAARLTEMARLIDEGALKPVIGEVLPLADAAKAHELSETGHVRGKIVLRVA
jgi:NADPH:quinone reductase-like Zn-dependent oxidoreductase